MSYIEQWNGLVMQIAQLQQAMTELDHESPYYARAREYADVLMTMIQKAWLTDVLSAPTKDKKPRKKKEKQGRKNVPYINNVEDRQKIVDILAHIITTRFTGNNMLLMDDTLLSTPRFFAYTFSALHEAQIPKNDNLNAFCEILSDAVAKAETPGEFTTEYSAIYDALKNWKKWKGDNNPYDFVHISEISVEDIKDEKNRDRMLQARDEYYKVCEILRDEQLILPPEKQPK